LIRKKKTYSMEEHKGAPGDKRVGEQITVVKVQGSLRPCFKAFKACRCSKR
jgi:hypothetical protein